MSITPEMMYWLTRCDNIVIASTVLAIAFGMLFGITLIAIMADEDQRILVRVVCSLSFVFALTSVASCILIPSTREMAAIYVVPKIANSQTVKDLGEGVVTLAREWLEELRPEKKGGAK